MASIVRFDKFYPATSGTMGAAAQVGDILVVACGSNTLNHATCTVTGATATMVEQQFQSGTGSLFNAITILTGTVTVAGTPAFSVSADTDMGFGCWIVRGLSSATKNTGSGAFGVGNPLTATVNPGVVCTLLIAYLNENTNNFTSWNGSINAEGVDAAHVDAYGDQLAVPSGSISPGANVTSHGDNTICFIFLPETVAAGSDGKPLGPFHSEGPGLHGPRGRTMRPQLYPDTIPFVQDGSARFGPFRRGMKGPRLRTMFPQQYPTSGGLTLYTMPASVGVFTLTGIAAAFQHNDDLVAAPGTFVLTGNAANLLHGYVVPAAQGIFVLTGIAANFLRAYVLTAVKGTFLLTGNVINLLVGRVVGANAGTIVLAGNSANFQVNRVLSASAGSFVFVGSSANLVYSAAGGEVITQRSSFLASVAKLINRG